MELVAELVSGPRALDPDAGIVGAWRALAVSTRNAFVSPEWFAAWTRHHGAGAEVRVVVVRGDADEIVGVLPVSLRGRALRVAGSELADHAELLARPSDQVAVARAAGAALAAAYPNAHLRLLRVDQGAPWVEALGSGWAARLTRARFREDVLPHLPLPGSWDEFLAGRSRNFRNQVGRKERNLVKHHGAVFRRTEDPADLDADMKRFFALHEGRWSGDDATSSLLAPRVQLMHTDFATAALDRGWLRLWFLEAGGQEVATIYGWTVGGRACYFNAGWDPRWSGESVGLVLLAHAVRSAIEEGASDYDFLLGDEQYKYRFATEERAVESLQLARPLSRAHMGLRVAQGRRRLTQAVPPERRARIKAKLGPAANLVPGARRG
jgi:CelD/BcsL family acetyltransferase involved in cellulose biosynthesis